MSAVFFSFQKNLNISLAEKMGIVASVKLASPRRNIWQCAKEKKRLRKEPQKENQRLKKEPQKEKQQKERL